jgi:hypothetical protein
MMHLTKIAELDRRWFLHHPGRCYRARYATPAERHVFEGGDDLVLLRSSTTSRTAGSDILAAALSSISR